MSLNSSSILRPIFSLVKKKRGLGVRGYKKRERAGGGGGGGFPTGKEGGRRPINEVILLSLALRANL